MLLVSYYGWNAIVSGSYNPEVTGLCLLPFLTSTSMVNPIDIIE